MAAAFIGDAARRHIIAAEKPRLAARKNRAAILPVVRLNEIA
jgi:hypothetical protein